MNDPRKEPLPADLQSKLERCLPLRGLGSVLLLGDSMLARFQDYGAGRNLLDTAVYENAAVGGSTTCHWNWLLEESGHFPSKVLRRYDHIVLMLGTNDLGNLEVSAQDVIMGLGNIIEFIKAKAPQSTIYFVTILPRWDLPHRGTFEWDRKAINEAISQHCTVLSLDSLLDQSHFAEDALHLNRKGYEMFAAFLQDKLQFPSRS